MKRAKHTYKDRAALTVPEGCRELTDEEASRINGGGKERSDEQKSSPDSQSPQGSQSSSVTVQSGDTLSELTESYNKANGTNYTYKDIAKTNGITDPDKIYPGQTIIFPSNSTQSKATSTQAGMAGTSSSASPRMEQGTTSTAAASYGKQNYFDIIDAYSRMRITERMGLTENKITSRTMTGDIPTAIITNQRQWTPTSYIIDHENKVIITFLNDQKALKETADVYLDYEQSNLGYKCIGYSIDGTNTTFFSHSEMVQYINTYKPAETNSGIDWKKVGNFSTGLGEVVLGSGIIVLGGFAGAALAPETMGESAMITYDATITGGGLIAFGITRMTGMNNASFREDLGSILVPPMSVFSDINKEDVTK